MRDRLPPDIERRLTIDVCRQQQPISELERKAAKAHRRGFYTQEDIDLAKAKSYQWLEFLADAEF